MNGGTMLLRPAVGTRNVLVPQTSRTGAAAGISLITRSRWPAVAIQWALWGLAATIGPRAVPGEQVAWEPPGGAAPWAALRTALPAFQDLAVYQRPQASRTGLAALLLRDGRPVGFLKLREDVTELDREEAALGAFPDGRAATFRVPRVLDRGSAGGLHWMLLSTMPPRPAAPASFTALGPVLADLRRHLAAALPVPAGTPAHWEPMHGDLTAWNLRRSGRGLPWLIDWEDASWAPPGADVVYYRATTLAAFRKPPGRWSLRGLDTTPGAHKEAVEFWLTRCAARPATDHDAAFGARLIESLGALL